MRRLPLPSLAVAMVLGCSGKEDTDTRGNTATFVFDTSEDPVSGFARVVNLVVDVEGIDIVVNDADEPIIADVPLGMNTDDDGYAPFPPGLYSVSAEDASSGAELARIDGEAVEFNTYYTVLFYGSVTAGAADAALGPAGWGYTDNTDDAPTGQHHLTLFHMAPGADPVDVWADGVEQHTGLAYGQATAVMSLVAGNAQIGLDTDDDDDADTRFTLALDDGGWSHAYLLPTPAGDAQQLFHHVTEREIATVAQN